MVNYLKSFSILLVLLLLSEGQAQTGRDSMATLDAIILTLRLQQGIKLDTLLAREIDQALEAARTQLDTLRSIHAQMDYVPTQLLLRSDAPWTQAWREGNLMTGNPIIDSLSVTYQMASVEVFNYFFDFSIFVLNFARPIKIPLLAKLYTAVPGVVYAEPNGIIGDGDNIEGFKKNGLWHLAFSLGWGDCLAGCIYRYYWYITVAENLKAQLIEERARDFTQPRIWLWNIPDRYPATVFSSVEELLHTAQSAREWWVRRHAVEVIGRLYVKEYPWVGEDLENAAIFYALQQGVHSRRDKVVQVLIQLLDDPDPDVQASTQWALNCALRLTGGSLAFYFPLNMGNHWTFSVDWPQTETIIDTFRMADSLYFQFDRFRGFPHTSLRMTYDNKLLLRDSFGDQKWLDFSAAVGDTWSVSEPDSRHLTWTVSLQSKTDTVVVPAGTFTNCYRFWFAFHGRDNDWVEWYAPGVGPVKRILYGIAKHELPLTEAMVDGVRYPTAIPEAPELNQPTKFALFQNYPNPFNASTVICYNLSGPGFVTLEIYNLLGQKVRTLIAERKDAGSHQTLWIGTDDSGLALPTGIYVVRLQSQGVNQVRKTILIR